MMTSQIFWSQKWLQKKKSGSDHASLKVSLQNYPRPLFGIIFTPESIKQVFREILDFSVIFCTALPYGCVRRGR